jgi:hypothetical protein
LAGAINRLTVAENGEFDFQRFFHGRRIAESGGACNPFFCIFFCGGGSFFLTVLVET